MCECFLCQQIKKSGATDAFENVGTNSSALACTIRLLHTPDTANSILQNTEHCKSSMMECIDHLLMEYSLICHYLNKKARCPQKNMPKLPPAPKLRKCNGKCSTSILRIQGLVEKHCKGSGSTGRRGKLTSRDLH